MAAALMVTMSACEQRAADPAAPAGADTAAASADALSGTWTFDTASLKFEGKPDQYLLQGGTYKCDTCIPPLMVAADGAFHPVADRPYYDSISVKTVDDRTVEFRRQKGGKDVSSSRWQVSEDGNVLTTKFVDMNTPNNRIEGSNTAKRVGAAPAGAHAISGQWTPDRLQEYSKEALDTTFAVDGNRVTMNGQGQSYTAEIGGPAVAVQNDPGGTMIAVTREGANGIRETATRGGKEVGISTFVPSADGQSINGTFTDPRDGSKTSWIANKKS